MKRQTWSSTMTSPFGRRMSHEMATYALCVVLGRTGPKARSNVARSFSGLLETRAANTERAFTGTLTRPRRVVQHGVGRARVGTGDRAADPFAPFSDVAGFY